MKRCPICCETKSVDEFSRLSRSSDGRQGYCKSCAAVRRAQYERDNRDAINARRRANKRRLTRDETYDLHLRRAFKMTLADHEALVDGQGGRCAGCGSDPGPDKRLNVDHDHSCCPGPTSCGECVRGLLCFNCNAALGNIGDSRETLMNLARYLDAYATR